MVASEQRAADKVDRVMFRAAPARARRVLSVSLAALMACASAAFAPVSAETLREALTSTYQTNPRIDAERARLRATDESVPQAKAGYRPRVNASADVGYQRRESNPGLTSDGQSNPAGYSINASQSLFSGYRTVNTVREAEANVRVGRENLRFVEQQVLLEAVTAYADVLRDQALVRLREAAVAVLSQDLQAAEARRSVREVTRTDVAQAQARRARAVSAMDLAKSNLQTSRATYLRVVGRTPLQLVDPEPPRRLLPPTIEEAMRVAEKESPNVVSALYREKAARHAVDKIWGELLPEVRVEASYGHRYNPIRGTNDDTGASVSGRLTVPLYEGGDTQARVRAAKHTHVSRLQEIEQARGETQAQVVSAWSRVQAARAQLKSDRVQVEASRVALEGTREEERVGQRNFLDVLNAEQELLDAEVAAVVTKRELIVASYTLIGIIGRLNADELKLESAVYDPEAHYGETARKWWGVSITHANGRTEFLERLDDWGADDKYMERQ
jgi:outer membrane protein